MAVDEASYRTFVTGRRRALRRTAFFLTGDWHLAEDIVQVVLTKLATEVKEALAMAPDWAILQEMDPHGEFPELVWEYASAVVSGDLPASGKQISLERAPTDLRCSGW